jgi:hypothetical protein
MGALNSLATLGLNLALSQRAQRAEAKDLREQRDREIEQIRLRDAEARREAALALRRRLAEERARAGAAGVGSTGGAADAILSGLIEESRQAEAARARQAGARIDEIHQSYDNRRRSSLLDFTSRWLAYGRSGGRSRSLLD